MLEYTVYCVFNDIYLYMICISPKVWLHHGCMNATVKLWDVSLKIIPHSKSWNLSRFKIQWFAIWVFPKIGKPPKRMVKIRENPMNKWMTWGGKFPTPIFGSTPICYLEDHPRTCKWLGSPLFLAIKRSTLEVVQSNPILRRTKTHRGPINHWTKSWDDSTSRDGLPSNSLQKSTNLDLLKAILYGL